MSDQINILVKSTKRTFGSQPGSYCISQPTLVRWVVSQAAIVYPNRPWFAGWLARLLLYTPTGPGSLGGQPRSYCIPQPTWFDGWSAKLLLYTPTDPGSLGGQPGSYCIPQPTLVRWVVSQAPIVYPNRPWFVGWSARLLLYT